MDHPRTIKPLLQNKLGGYCLSVIFQHELDTIELTDRYVFAGADGCQALESFLIELSGVWKTKPKKINITYGPATNRDEAEWRANAEDSVAHLQSLPAFADVTFNALQRASHHSFGDTHDRKIHISEYIAPPEKVDTTGLTRKQKRDLAANRPKTPAKKTLTAALTSGISYLMNQRLETSAFIWIK